jgi:hypothetical protein
MGRVWQEIAGFSDYVIGADLNPSPTEWLAPRLEPFSLHFVLRLLHRCLRRDMPWTKLSSDC